MQDSRQALRLVFAAALAAAAYLPLLHAQTTLRELARVKPRSVEELSGIYGIGESKAAKFGKAFVDAITGEA